MSEDAGPLLAVVLARLRQVSRLDFHARSGPGSQMQWNHDGTGHVQVSLDDEGLHFTEHFLLDNGLPCQDRKCWQLTPAGIVFRHFRQQRFQDILLLQPRLSTGADGTPVLPAHADTPHPLHSPGPRPAAPELSGPAFPRQAASLPATPLAVSLLRLYAQAPFSCPPDRYDGCLTLADDTLTLTLRITGPRKDESIRYTYHPDRRAPTSEKGP